MFFWSCNLVCSPRHYSWHNEILKIKILSGSQVTSTNPALTQDVAQFQRLFFFCSLIQLSETMCHPRSWQSFDHKVAMISSDFHIWVGYLFGTHCVFSKHLSGLLLSARSIWEKSKYCGYMNTNLKANILL